MIELGAQVLLAERGALDLHEADLAFAVQELAHLFTGESQRELATELCDCDGRAVDLRNDPLPKFIGLG